MNSKIWRIYNHSLQMLSILFGFLLMIGLSINGLWSSFFVVFLIVTVASRECFWLRKIKNIQTIHWFGTNWILLAAAIAYILTSNMLVKVFLFWAMMLSIYVNLYRECYYEKLSLHHIKCILGDLPILCFYYIEAFFKKDELVFNRIKRHKIIIGVSILLMILACLFFPLYISVDNRISTILYMIIGQLISLLPLWIICALLGMIPAVINYSIVRGLAWDVVLQNPERNEKITVYIDNESMYFNDTVVKIILWGLVVVNVVLIGLQISYMFQIQELQEDMESLYSMKGALPLLVAIATSILFIVMSEYFIIKRNKESELSKITFVYIGSLICLLLLLVYRYVLKITRYGIKSFDLIGLSCTLLLGIVLVVAIRSMMVNGTGILDRLTLWVTVCFVILSLLPVEYIVSQINVCVFLSQYQKGTFSEMVEESDIDIDFLEQMKYNAVPAMVRLMDVTLMYDGTDMSVGETVKKMVVEMFYSDMSAKEIEAIGELQTEKEISEFQRIFGGKVEYQVMGKKRIAYIAFCDRLEAK